MKMVLVCLLFLISLNGQSEEIKIVLDKPSVYTGEVVAGIVSDYSGPEISEKRIDDSIHILFLDQNRIEMIFLKKPQTNKVYLSTEDALHWNPIEVMELEIPQTAIIHDLNFDLKNRGWIVYLVILAITLMASVFMCFKKLKPRLEVKKRKRAVKEVLVKAHTFEEVTAIWKNKHFYIETFPFIEEEFNKFEVVFYKYAFRPNLSREDQAQVTKSYSKFLDSIRGGHFGV